METESLLPGSEEPTVDSRQRILMTAEKLYMEHGYRAVSLRDIASALSIKQSSLYYHFPEGKEQLFEAVVEQSFTRHKVGIETAIASQGNDLRKQILAVIDWFNSQPPMNFMAIIHADMPALHPERIKTLEKLSHSALFQPMLMMFVEAMQRGEIRTVNPAMLTGFMLAILSGMRYGTSQVQESERSALIGDVVDVILLGVYPR